MKGYIIDIEFTWGFQCKIIGLSKTSPSFFYPPPTTFLGALAESIARDNTLGEEKGKKLIPALSKKLMAIGVRPLNAIPLKHEDLNRIITIKVTGGKLYPRPDDLARSFDSPARGKTIFSSIDGEAPKLRFFLVLHDNILKTDKGDLEITGDYFWNIHRLGSKESLVSTINVEELDNLKIISNSRIITNYSFPMFKEVKSLQQKQVRWNAEIYINPFKIEKYRPLEYISGFNLIPFRIPILVTNPPEYIIEIEKNVLAFKYGKEVVVGCSI